MDKYDLLSKMTAQDGRQSKNDLDHVTRAAIKPEHTDGRVLL